MPDLRGILVGPDLLGERLGHPNVRIVDLRDAEAYAGGHVPGAVQLDLEALGAHAHGLDNVLLGPSDFAALMASIGISTGDTVVAYDDQWGLAAARLVWALHRYGHERAAVLNGGWDRWVEEGRQVATGPESWPEGDFVPVPRSDVLAERDWIRERLEGGGLRLLDTRTRAEWEGGHLPGAASWDWLAAVPPGSWDVARDTAELLDEWRALGLHPSDEVVVYCRSGMRAAHTWVVLRQAGFDRVRLYDGSWQEWSMSDGGQCDR